MRGRYLWGLMNLLRSTTHTLAVLLPALLSAQNTPDANALELMRSDVRFLASDSLQGRLTATPFERIAADHIALRFQRTGLSPAGDSASYLQAFTFEDAPTLGPANAVQVGRNMLLLGTEYYPVSLSATGSVFSRLAKCSYGILAPDIGRNDYEGVVVKDRAAAICISSPDGIHPHSKWINHHDLGKRINDAVALGANAILLYNDDPDATDPDSTLSKRIKPCGVPVVFLTKAGFRKLGLDGEPVIVQVDIQRPVRTGHNVVALIDNGQPNVVVIGAHYDHLGMGVEGSLHRGGSAVHNGADDNASGVAVMLQLAADLRNMPEARNNDYLFIGFSGEELGLYGSNWWTKHPTVPIAELNYMVNMDMVGRLDTTNDLAINGVGTSPAWQRLKPDPLGSKTPAPGKRSVPPAFNIKTTESGVGPSDHTSFYLQDVPVLHFFTGAHEDYHKPSDDEEKVNYEGMLRITRYIEQLIVDLDDEGKLAFTKTASDTTATPSFKVTLGVVPDYMYSGQGMRIDGVTDGKPAAAAGLRTGDVVLALGDQKVTDMMSYMRALGAFSKGESTKVTVLREGKEMNADITFK
jgi:hypothetical protein